MKELSTPCWPLLPETPQKECARKRVALGVDAGMQGVRCGSQGLGSRDGEEGWEEEVLEKMGGEGWDRMGVRVKVQEEVGRAAGWGQSTLSGKWGR